MNRFQTFWKTGHFPTLFSSFLYFDISFMCWVLIGATSNFIVADLGLTDAEKGLMVAVPILGGALLRIPLGILSDRFGGKRIGLIGMAITMIPLTWAWLFAKSLHDLFALGLLLGIAGASFSVALPLASRWYPDKYQGLVLGLVGAGNSGTAISMLFAPRLSEMYGWNNVFGIALIPMFITFCVFAILVKENPNRPKPQTLIGYLSIVRYKDTWFYSFVYSLSFGSFVGLASYLTMFFYDQYAVTRVMAGDFVTVLVFTASFVRPIGGYLADKYGGLEALYVQFIGISISLLILGFLLPIYITMVVFFFLFVCLGMANGSLLQLVPTRYSAEVGVLTGFIGAAGGAGGFLLPNILSTLKQLTGSFAYGFWWVGMTAIVAVIFIYREKRRPIINRAT